MYSYYGLPAQVDSAVRALESELRRPIVLLPNAPGSMSEWWTANHGLVEGLKETLEMPNLTVAQATELSILVVFRSTVPTASVELHLPDYGYVNWPRTQVDQPLPFSAQNAGEDEPPLGYVEPGRVVCALADVPYLPPNLERTGDMWESLYEAVRTAASDEVAADFEARRREALRAQVAELVTRNQQQAVHLRRSSISELERVLRSHETGFRAATADLRQQVVELDLLLRMQGEDQGERMLAEYDLLVEHPRVERVELEDQGSLAIWTDAVTMTHPQTSETRWLGCFKIVLRMARGDVRIHNLSNPRSGRDHPHVADGEPCFGGHHVSFTQLVTEGRWATFLELLFQYLETFNPADDWGRYGAYWFDSPDVDPSETPAAVVDRGPVVFVTDHGDDLYEGDRVSFYDDGEDARVAGVVVLDRQPTSEHEAFCVARDDGRGGGGPDDSWIMDGDSDEVELISRAATPTPA